MVLSSHYNAMDTAYFLVFHIFPCLFKISSAFKSRKILILSRVFTLNSVTFTVALMNTSEKQFNGGKVHFKSSFQKFWSKTARFMVEGNAEYYGC